MSGPAGLGHNRPPEPSLIERAQALVANANRWLSERKVIKDVETAKIGDDFVTQLRETTADLEAAHKAEREPFDLAIVALRIKYRDPLEMLGISLTKMKELLTPWLQAESDRLAREQEQRAAKAREAVEEADRARAAADEVASLGGNVVEAELQARRAEESARAAEKIAAKPVERPGVRGDYADRAMGLRVTWSAEVTSESLALKSYAKHPKIRAAALVAVRRQANDDARKLKDPTKALPGIKFIRKETAT